MKNTSSVNTLAATLTMTGTCATVEWVGNSLLKLAIPPQVVIELGALITTLSHFLVNVFNAYVTVNDPKFAAALNAEQATAPTTITQSGFANPVLLGMMALVMAATLMLSGCASQLQALTAANTSAVISVRAEADLAAKVAAEEFCHMSVDTLARNTQYIGGVKALCWAGSVSTPSDAADQLIAPTGVNTAVIQAPVTPAPVTVTVSTPTVTPAATPVPVPLAFKAAVKPAPKPIAAVTVPTPVPVATQVSAPAAPVPASTPSAKSLLSAPVIP